MDSDRAFGLHQTLRVTPAMEAGISEGSEGAVMKQKNQKSRCALEALNVLASVLTDYGHKWSKKERLLYSTAHRWITSFCDEDSAA